VHQQALVGHALISKLVKRVQSVRELERAWRAIQENARSSKSEEVRKEVEEFSKDAGYRVHSISARLSRGKFAFAPAKGIPIPKTGNDGKRSKTKFRPIVLAPLESRIVQRSILEVLMTHKAMYQYVQTPHSFGGVRRERGKDIAAVPAAIKAVLHSIGDGARFVASADIQGFFTKISKASVRGIVAGAIGDDAFMKLFDDAIKVELSNMAELREKAELFPIEDIGVAQGNSLSPLLGNILLFEFDKAMNEGDCRCIRYIDDFIILAPTKKAAAARRRKAIAILAGLGMQLSPEKSAKEPIDVKTSFQFLGIELNNGFIRPSGKSCGRVLAQIEDAIAKSLHAIRTHRAGSPFPKAHSLIVSLKHIDGIVNGWGKHYRFCNDENLVQKLDEEVKNRLGAYIGAYADARDRADESERQHLLGVQKLAAIERDPFQWPKSQSNTAKLNPVT
jgi:RNA-directed DNA polymerase